MSEKVTKAQLQHDSMGEAILLKGVRSDINYRYGAPFCLV